MLKLVSKFAMDVFPSVIATIIGAYIVNHYINNKTPADSATAAAVSTADPKKANSKGDPRPAEKSADIGNIPEPGVRAKGISEKAMIDKSPVEKTVEKPAEKADKPAETASIPPTTPAESRRHQPTAREKAAARTAPPPVPAPALPPSLPAEPVVAMPNTAPAETGPDANDLARAAIERLHRASTASEPARAPDPPRVIGAPAAVPSPAATGAPPVQPLPPPILVSTPPDAKPPYPPAARPEDPQRPRPPAEIPNAPPLDLRADAVEAQPQGRPSVAEDVLSAAKSMFHSVLPK